jgi:DNA-binding transcriptional ArsR family regulator
MADGGTGTRRLDSLSLRALAHPLRVEILAMLRADGPATLTMLADRSNQRSGTVAWHLKILARHDLIEEVPGRGVGRERYWQAAQQRTELDIADFLGDPAASQPLRGYVGGLVALHHRRATEWAAGEWDAEWTGSATVSDWTLRLRPQALGALVEEIRAVVARHQAAADPAGEQVFVQLQAFPHHED